MRRETVPSGCSSSCLCRNPAHLLEAIDVPAVTTSGIPTADILSEDDRELARPGAEFAARLGLHR